MEAIRWGLAVSTTGWWYCRKVYKDVSYKARRVSQLLLYRAGRLFLLCEQLLNDDQCCSPASNPPPVPPASARWTQTSLWPAPLSPLWQLRPSSSSHPNMFKVLCDHMFAHWGAEQGRAGLYDLHPGWAMNTPGSVRLGSCQLSTESRASEPCNQSQTRIWFSRQQEAGKWESGKYLTFLRRKPN